MATKRKVKFAPERAKVTKVWNVSDWPATDVESQLLMVLGVSVAPGACIEVPDERLVNAHKTQKDKEAGLLYIGDQPPPAYLAFKRRKKHLRLPPGVKRAHGPFKEPGTPTPQKKAPVATPLKKENPPEKKDPSSEKKDSSPEKKDESSSEKKTGRGLHLRGGPKGKK